GGGGERFFQTVPAAERIHWRREHGNQRNRPPPGPPLRVGGAAAGGQPDGGQRAPGAGRGLRVRQHRRHQEPRAGEDGGAQGLLRPHRQDPGGVRLRRRPFCAQLQSADRAERAHGHHVAVRVPADLRHQAGEPAAPHRQVPAVCPGAEEQGVAPSERARGGRARPHAGLHGLRGDQPARQPDAANLNPMSHTQHCVTSMGAPSWNC
ncbi:hypothetical protein CRUP_035288, partial [Coryphaenoides rupestris]